MSYFFGEPYSYYERTDQLGMLEDSGETEFEIATNKGKVWCIVKWWANKNDDLAMDSWEISIDEGKSDFTLTDANGEEATLLYSQVVPELISEQALQDLIRENEGLL